MGVRCYYIALSLVIAGFGREFSSLKSRIQEDLKRYIPAWIMKAETSRAFKNVSTHLNSMVINTVFRNLDDSSQSIYGEQQPKRDLDRLGPSFCG